MIDKNKIPGHWGIELLKNVCQVVTGATPSKKEIDNYGEEIPFVKPPQVLNNSIFDAPERLSTKGARNARLLPINSVLVTCIGNLGRTSINKVVVAFNQQINALIPSNNLFGLFLFYQAQSSKFNEQLNSLVSATTVPIVNKSKFESIQIVVPPISEQHQIVSKIEELFSELDKGKKQLETVKQQLKTFRQAVLKWAFEGRFTSTIGTGRDLSPDDQNNPQLPKGWKWVKSGEVIETINNGYTPKSGFMSQNAGEIPFIKVYNLNFDGTINFEKNPTFIPRSIHEKELKRSVCYPNDVLINIVGPPLGKVSIVSKQFEEWNINQAIVMFRPNENILSRFLSYYLQNPNTINWLEDTSKATAGQWNVKVSTCRMIPIPLPPVSEQERIVQEIESRLSVCDKMEETIEISLKQAESLRQSILKQAFEGKLPVATGPFC